jgi:TolB-like protein/Tfp pilus assembly protein PilF
VLDLIRTFGENDPQEARHWGNNRATQAGDVSPLPSTQAAVRFGDFSADLRAGELRKNGLRIKLQVQPFQVLQILLERAGEVISREELQKRIWPADTFVDFDHGLNNAVKKLREALGDDAEKPRFIETLSKRGYRFIGRVEELANAVRTPLGPPAPVIVDSIAVLPFTSMSPDSEDEFFTDGMTEEIINALAQIEHLHVAARSSAFFFKSKHVDLQAIGERLKVRTVLEGNVRRAGNRLRITAQLVNVADGYHLWSERYDREMKDVFEIQDEIARSIADRLKVTLGGDRQEPLVKAGTKNLEAYELYLKGRALLPRRGSAIPRGLECLERAVRLDPGYARAWAGVADSYTTLGYYGLARPEATMPKGMEAARRSVALDPSLAEAHSALAMARLMGAWDKAEAEREFLRALELNPKYLQARGWYALFYLQFAEGRLPEGVAQAKLALESDPLSSYAHTIYSFTCAFAGKHAEAVQVSRRAVELDSESYLAHAILAAVLYLSERFEEAVAASESALAISGRHPWAMVVLAESLADCGKRAEAEAAYSELICRARRSYVQPSSLAMTAAAVGLQDEAIRYAREAFEIRDPFSPVWFSKIWPPSARLRMDPRFAGLAEDTGWLSE